MPFAVELYFDRSSEKRIRDVWKIIDKARINSAMLKAGYRPHVSLGVCNHLESNTFKQELSAFAAGISPLRLSFSSVDTFPTSEGVVFLDVRVTEQLLDVHTAFHEIFKKYAQEQREYYTVGNWAPHCTLAFGLPGHQIAEAVKICQQISLPLSTEVREIGVVEVSPTSCQTLYSCDLKPQKE